MRLRIVISIAFLVLVATSPMVLTLYHLWASGIIFQGPYEKESPPPTTVQDWIGQTGKQVKDLGVIEGKKEGKKKEKKKETKLEPGKIPSKHKRGSKEWFVDQYKHISIVVTWINTSHPADRGIRRWLGRPTPSDAGDRCMEDRQIRYAFRSLEKYMPWHEGTVYLVTPGYWPHWLNRSHPRLKVVHQNAILYPEIPVEDLQTAKEPVPLRSMMNSNAIEQMWDRLPGITDHLLHWNDDYMMAKPVYPDSFFREDGGVIMFMGPDAISWDVASLGSSIKKAIWRAATALSWKAVDDAYGERRNKHYKLKHSPFAYHKGVLTAMKKKKVWKQRLKDTAKHPFRNWTDMITPILHNSYVSWEPGSRFKGDMATPQELKKHFYISYKLQSGSLAKELENVNRTRPTIFTVNGACSTRASAMTYFSWMAEFYPKPSSFELPNSEDGPPPPVSDDVESTKLGKLMSYGMGTLHGLVLRGMPHR